ncbi:hypothetical protein [Pseudomonas sp. Leaf127]|uniref:hypothetical protein n=1 Tax=Pseudomonas sp. Leaf127 TaxID=1736267 RepID=UPI0012E85C0E|nr:hypothetical protein [Pseudomonas sp. Leaf127]
MTGRFNDELSDSYSGDLYINNSTNVSSLVVGKGRTICLACVKDQKDSFGFSFWRRSLQSPATVCPTHNLVLLKECQACKRAFSLNRYKSDVLWEGCVCGTKIENMRLTENSCLAEAKWSMIVHDFFNCEYFISFKSAYKVFDIRLGTPGWSTIVIRDASPQWSSNGEVRKIFLMEKDWINLHSSSKDSKLIVLGLIDALFGDFNEFLTELKLIDRYFVSIYLSWCV